jgi:hypothetical protein
MDNASRDRLHGLISDVVVVVVMVVTMMTTLHNSLP